MFGSDFFNQDRCQRKTFFNRVSRKLPDLEDSDVLPNPFQNCYTQLLSVLMHFFINSGRLMLPNLVGKLGGKNNGVHIIHVVGKESYHSCDPQKFTICFFLKKKSFKISLKFMTYRLEVFLTYFLISEQLPQNKNPKLSDNQSTAFLYSMHFFNLLVLTMFLN